MIAFLSIANLVIGVQAIFLSIHFMIKKKGIRQLNLLVSVQVFVFAVISLNTYVILSGYSSDLFQEFANNTMWFLGPSIYLFVRYHHQTLTTNILLKYYSPFVLLFVVGLITYQTEVVNFMPILGLIQLLIFLLLSLIYSFQEYKRAPSFFNWALPSILTFAFILIANVLFKMLRTFELLLIADELLLSMTTLLGFPVFFMAYKEMNTSQDFGLAPKKYATSHLSDAQLTTYLKMIDLAVKNDKLFLDPELKLSTLSAKLDIPQKYISQAINQKLGKSFNEYLVEIKLHYAEQALLDPQNQHMTIHGIAQSMGFVSLSRFNQHFKKHKGMTPGQFQRLHLKK